MSESPTIDTLERQVRSGPIDGSTDEQQLGFSRDINPCPKSGRITFKQIGDLIGQEGDIDCDDEELMICREPPVTGDLGKNDKPLRKQSEAGNDPSDFYNACWGHNYDFIRGYPLGPNPVGRFCEMFSDPQPEGYGERGVQIKTYEDGGEYFRLYAYTSDKNWQGDFVEKATYLVSYVGRFAPNTKLTIYFEYNGDAGDWTNPTPSFSLRGWSDGWYQGETKEYISTGLRTNDRYWSVFEQEFTVDSVHRDIWIAFQQNTSTVKANYENLYVRNVQIWRS